MAVSELDPRIIELWQRLHSGETSAVVVEAKSLSTTGSVVTRYERHVLLSYAQTQLGMLDRAYDDALVALKIAVENDLGGRVARAHEILAANHRRQGRFESALHHYELALAAVSSDRDRFAYALKLAHAAHAVGAFSSSRSALEEAEKTGLKPATVTLQRLSLALTLRDLDTVEALLASPHLQAHPLDPSQTFAFFRIRGHYLLLTAPEKAAPLFRQAIEHNRGTANDPL
jgi:tetratricopeptide (TPR) repeat protein